MKLLLKNAFPFIFSFYRSIKSTFLIKISVGISRVRRSFCDCFAIGQLTISLSDNGRDRFLSVGLNVSATLRSRPSFKDPASYYRLYVLGRVSVSQRPVLGHISVTNRPVLFVADLPVSVSWSTEICLEISSQFFFLVFILTYLYFMHTFAY